MSGASYVVAAHLDYLRQLRLSETTRYQRSRALARLADQLSTPLCLASARDLAAWRASLTIGDDAIVAYVCHVRQFYAWLIAVGLREDNPAAGLPVPKLGRRLPRPIGEPDLLSAFACAPARIRPWLVLAAWSGLRAKEIALLRRVHVLDTAAPPVLLVASDATKGIRERVVPMAPFVVAELHLAGLPASGHVFRRLDGQPGPNAPWLVSHLANNHLHECGIGATLHQLRHRFGTQTYAACRDIRVVQELLGHAYPSTTAGYAAYNQADARAAVDALPVPGPRSLPASG